MSVLENMYVTFVFQMMNVLTIPNTKGSATVEQTLGNIVKLASLSEINVKRLVGVVGRHSPQVLIFVILKVLIFL